jgi:hypothetical protein
LCYDPPLLFPLIYPSRYHSGHRSPVHPILKPYHPLKTSVANSSSRMRLNCKHPHP